MQFCNTRTTSVSYIHFCFVKTKIGYGKTNKVTWERFIRSGKQQAITDAVNKVFQNSRKVSHFISNLNPCKLPFKVVLHHFNQHNQYVIDMSLTRKNGDFEKDIQIFDTYYTQLLDFADLFLNGLVDGC